MALAALLGHVLLSLLAAGPLVCQAQEEYAALAETEASDLASLATCADFAVVVDRWFEGINSFDFHGVVEGLYTQTDGTINSGFCDGNPPGVGLASVVRGELRYVAFFKLKKLGQPDPQIKAEVQERFGQDLNACAFGQRKSFSLAIEMGPCIEEARAGNPYTAGFVYLTGMISERAAYVNGQLELVEVQPFSDNPDIPGGLKAKVFLHPMKP